MNGGLRYVSDFVASRFPAAINDLPSCAAPTLLAFWRALVFQMLALILTQLQSKAKTLGIASSSGRCLTGALVLM